MIGQVAGFVLEISTVIWFGRGPQDTLSVEVDIILMIHKNPAPGGQKKPNSSLSGLKRNIRKMKKKQKKVTWCQTCDALALKEEASPGISESRALVPAHLWSPGALQPLKKSGSLPLAEKDEDKIR